MYLLRLYLFTGCVFEVSILMFKDKYWWHSTEWDFGWVTVIIYCFEPDECNESVQFHGFVKHFGTYSIKGPWTYRHMYKEFIEYRGLSHSWGITVLKGHLHMEMWCETWVFAVLTSAYHLSTNWYQTCYSFLNVINASCFEVLLLAECLVTLSDPGNRDVV